MTLPNMSAALWGLMEQITFTKVVKTIVDHQVSEETGPAAYGAGGFGNGPYDGGLNKQFKFVGTLQPIPPWRLKIKPEGQRTWKFWQLWTQQALSLDDVLFSGGKKYRVMGIIDWNQAAYYSYELAEEFDQVTPT